VTVSNEPWPVVGKLITLVDGSTATVRPIAADDGGALLDFHRGLSDRSQYLRYFYPHSALTPDEVVRFTQVDGVARVAFVLEQQGALLAVGRYDRLDDPTQAEVAFVVADKFQHHGIATLLLHHLVQRARECGITHLVAEVLDENKAMLAVFHATGFPTQSENKWGTVELSMRIVPEAAESADAQTGTRQSSRVPPPSAT
jgi:GNAT superfamily N-acetyltransferase